MVVSLNSRLESNSEEEVTVSVLLNVINIVTVSLSSYTSILDDMTLRVCTSLVRHDGSLGEFLT